MENEIDQLIKDIGDMITYIKKNLKPSREGSLVVTKLEEAQLWLTKVAD